MNKSLKQKINNLNPQVKEKLLKRLAAEQVEKKLQQQKVKKQNQDRVKLQTTT